MDKETKQKEERIKAEKNTVRAIIDNYKGLAGSLAQQLTLKTPNHHVTTGSHREEVWKSLFVQMVPRKFHIEQGVFIIDSEGHISDEVDLAIFDENYTPYIFKFGKIKFIPIEAVAVAVQCKSSNINGAEDWAKSIKRLLPAFDSVTRVLPGLNHNNLESAKMLLEKEKKQQSQTATRPILILCSLVEKGNPADPHREGTTQHGNAKDFDIILNVDENNQLSQVIPNENWDYREWYKELNHYDLKRYKECDDYEKVAMGGSSLGKTLKELEIDKEGENVILSLTFQLNQLLMLINNPMFFPHQSYVEMFRKHLKNTDRVGKEQTETNSGGTK
ncbi:DUF6602 domain-containing protein [Brevibacillus parabrevis]|uniref:DUF6602 domain-containing protein n=1 Tax=Brevibacillus parabrevis TaxID=54914 RepID=UPI0028D36779|nr:DUF6602 domain-containing protein [Brevibacillus parabrevis]